MTLPVAPVKFTVPLFEPLQTAASPDAVPPETLGVTLIRTLDSLVPQGAFVIVQRRM